jgi:hypothetical protein
MTVICLRRNETIRPILISLDVESTVYLYSVEIQPDRRAETRLMSRQKTARSATWTDLISFEDDLDEVRIGLKWVTMGSASPGRRYTATLSILDEDGGLMPPKPGYANPVAIKGRIGPAADPTDERHVSIVIR